MRRFDIKRWLREGGFAYHSDIMHHIHHITSLSSTKAAARLTSLIQKIIRATYRDLNPSLCESVQVYFTVLWGTIPRIKSAKCRSAYAWLFGIQTWSGLSLLLFSPLKVILWSCRCRVHFLSICHQHLEADTCKAYATPLSWQFSLCGGVRLSTSVFHLYFWHEHCRTRPVSVAESVLVDRPSPKNWTTALSILLGRVWNVIRHVLQTATPRRCVEESLGCSSRNWNCIPHFWRNRVSAWRNTGDLHAPGRFLMNHPHVFSIAWSFSVLRRGFQSSRTIFILKLFIKHAV
jgi:hypothetical protein